MKDLLTPDEVQVGVTYYTHSGRRWTVRQRLTVEDMIRLKACSAKQRKYIREETSEEHAEYLRTLRSMARQGMLFK